MKVVCSKGASTYYVTSMGGRGGLQNDDIEENLSTKGPLAHIKRS